MTALVSLLLLLRSLLIVKLRIFPYTCLSTFFGNNYYSIGRRKKRNFLKPFFFFRVSNCLHACTCMLITSDLWLHGYYWIIVNKRNNSLTNILWLYYKQLLCTTIYRTVYLQTTSAVLVVQGFWVYSLDSLNKIFSRFSKERMTTNTIFVGTTPVKVHMPVSFVFAYPLHNLIDREGWRKSTKNISSGHNGNTENSLYDSAHPNHSEKANGPICFVFSGV